MSALQYRGRAPDSDFTVVPKKWVDDRYNVLKVDTAFINATVAAEMADRTNTSYVDNQDAVLAHKSAVDTADAGYLPTATLGDPNGVASLGADVYVPAAQLPATLQTERAPFMKNADQIFLTSGTREISTVNPREYEAARLTIPDLGFTYTPLLFAVIQGGAINGVNASRAMGTGNYAQISVLRADNVRYSYMLTTGQKGWDTFTCLPSADSITPVAGANTFSLWLGLQTGTTYTFRPDGLRFYAIAMPAL